MKLLIIAFAILFVSSSCSKNESEAVLKESIIIVNDNGKSYRLTPSICGLDYSSAKADILLTAHSDLMSIMITAFSNQHTSGVGDYLFSTTYFQEKFVGGMMYYPISIPGTNLTKGSLTITKRDEKSYEGRFVFYGQNYNGQEKVFTGSFVNYY